VLRTLSLVKEKFEWRVVHPIVTYLEGVEKRLIWHALRRRKPATEALMARLMDLKAELILPREDHVLRIPPDPIGRAILVKGAYQRDLFERAIRIAESHNRLRAGGVLLDIGANIGMHTIYAHLSGRFDRVVSVEPFARNFRFLEFNIRENGFQDKTFAVRCAGGRAPSVARLYIDPGNCAKATLVEPSDQFELVEVRPIDSILSDLVIKPSEVGMVWIDVMGAEVEVLAGMPEVISGASPLVLEFANRKFSRADKEEMFRLLAGPYSSFIDLKTRDEVAMPVKDICRFEKRWTNLLFL